MASKDVNRPTDVKTKEQDVNNKLQLYGIYSAFAQGKAPSNKQIDIALNSALQSRALSSPPENLSEEGKSLVADLKDVIEQAKLLLLSKNEGELLQEFIWETQLITASDASLPGAPVDKETAKQHGNDVLDGLRTLGTLFISNGQFRKLLSDSAVLLRSMAGDAASNAADYVQPSQEQLSQIDAPAEDNTWHENPDPEKLKSQAKGFLPFGKKDAKEVAKDASAAAHPQGSTDPSDTAALAARDQQQGTSTGVDVASGAQAGVDSLKAKAETEETSKAKEKAKEYNKRTQNYLKGKMPKERREQTLWRLKKMVVEVQGHADYQQAIETLLRLAEEYSGHTRAVASESQGTVKGVQADDNLRKAETNLKILLERFANGTSSDDFFDALNQVYRDADNDKELRDWFTKVNQYIRRCLREQGYIIQPAAQDDYNRLYDHGRYLLREKYRDHTDRVLDEIKFFGNQFDEDSQNRAFSDSVQRLFTDLGQDNSGKAAFKPHLVKDITEVILPRILENVRYVPIPRMEYQDPMVDVIVENLIIESDNLAPNMLEFSSDNYWKWGRKSVKNKNKNKVMLAVSGIQMDLRDVSFYVSKKQGFPSIKDQGLCDIFMGGEGFSFKLKMETADPSTKGHFFEVTDVKVQVKNFNIKLKQSKHKFLFALAKPIILLAMRPALQKVLEAAIKQKAKELDSIMYEIHQEATQAKRDIENNPDPENVKNMLQIYWQAANARWMRAKEKAKKVEEKVEGKKFNMAMTKHDSIFPNIDLPSGISTKATEYKDLAAKGDRWESPVFSIGNAKESTSVPKAPQVIRKHKAKPGASVGPTFGEKNVTQAPLGGSGLSSSGIPGQSALGAPPLGSNGTSNGAFKQNNGPLTGQQAPGSSVPPTFDPNSVA